jgi:electron transfer flavoprotein beta subunit
VSIGPAQAQETLRTALAMGADRGILVKTDEAVEPLAWPRFSRASSRPNSPGLIILGKQAIDDDSQPDRPDAGGAAGLGARAPSPRRSRSGDGRSR